MWFSWRKHPKGYKKGLQVYFSALAERAKSLVFTDEKPA
jgi:hypothetical protein